VYVSAAIAWLWLIDGVQPARSDWTGVEASVKLRTLVLGSAWSWLDSGP